MGAGCHDLLDPGRLEGLYVRLGLSLEQVLVAEAPGRVAGAGLLGPEHGEGHPGVVEQPGDRLGGPAGPLVEGAGAPHPEQVLDVVGNACHDDRDLEVEALGPVEAVALAQAPGVTLVFDVAQHGAGLGREPGLHQHLVAAHVEDGVDVLDVHRALLDARPAGGAGPQARLPR